MIDELVTAYGNRFLVAALGVSLALLCLFIVLWLLRNRAPSPFVRGGRNRQPRLQVLDAAAVDARRRLVLVRRDNVEHLVMIGGPTDIVIESGIGDERAYLSATPVQSAPLQVPAEVAPVAVAAPAEARALPQREAAPATTAPIEAPVSVRPATVPAATPAPAPVQPPLRAEAPAVSATPQAQARPMTPAPTPAPASNTELRRPEPAAIEPAIAQPAVQPVKTAPPMKALPTEPVAVAAPRPVAEPPKPATATPVAPLQPEKEVAPAAQPMPIAAAPAAVPTAATLAPAVAAPSPVTASFAMPAAATASTIAVAPSETPAVAVAPATTGGAADILEAARKRVLQPAMVDDLLDDDLFDEPLDEAPPARRSGGQSEFERVLEEEMALHLAANEAPAKPAAPVVPVHHVLPETRADRPVVPPVASPAHAVDPTRAAKAEPEEPTLQNEIARIFGEMSADRH